MLSREFRRPLCCSLVLLVSQSEYNLAFAMKIRGQGIRAEARDS